MKHKAWTIAICCGLVSQASAAIITVTNSNDHGPGSLRQAIHDAASDDEIVFDPALDGDPIVLFAGTLDVVRNLTITGNGPVNTIIDGNDSRSVFTVRYTAELRMSGVTIRNGRGQLGGGAHVTLVAGLSLDGSVVEGNTGEAGGGIYAKGGLSLNNTTVTGNSAEIGGGLDIRSGASIRNSTISNNTAESEGGGIFNRGHIRIENSTLSGNSAEIGGAIRNYLFVDLENVTITENTGTLGAGISVRWLTFPRNSVIANQVVGQDCHLEQPRLFSEGYNLDSDGSCGLTEPTDVSGVDPRLGPLADNGGPTLTHALLGGGPAVDSGSCTQAIGFPVTTDQRGEPRPMGPGCDRGAFELDGHPNEPPTALCRNEIVAVHAGCTAQASIDDGSFDPEGRELIYSQEPPGPYGLGTTEVILTVTDIGGASDSCSATVVVLGDTRPCP